MIDEARDEAGLSHLALVVACCSYQVEYLVYGSLVSCGKCKDGSCRICQSSCSFLAKISNYNDVKVACLANVLVTCEQFSKYVTVIALKELAGTYMDQLVRARARCVLK